ncbi:hypothetical protein [Yersinia phage PY100]|nr:hypothetical protein [Yersinia phage PY100]
MIDLKLDNKAWDISVEDGDFVLVDGAQSTSQNSKFGLQIILGEAFDDTRLGVPWLTDMVNPQIDLEVKKQILRNVIMDTDGAEKLTSMTLYIDKKDDGVMNCTYEGIADDGRIFTGEL